METNEASSTARCAHHPVLSPYELEVAFDLLIEYLKERYYDTNRSTRPDWNVVIQRFNLKFRRAKLTVKQLRCALNGKRAEFEAALVNSCQRRDGGLERSANGRDA